MTVMDLAAGTQRQRILDGVLRCIARWGMAKTTLEDIARADLGGYVGPEGAPRAAEWVPRVVLSYTLCPWATVDLRDPESTRQLVRTYVLPGLVITSVHQ